MLTTVIEFLNKNKYFIFPEKITFWKKVCNVLMCITTFFKLLFECCSSTSWRLVLCRGIHIFRIITSFSSTFFPRKSIWVYVLRIFRKKTVFSSNVAVALTQWRMDLSFLELLFKNAVPTRAFRNRRIHWTLQLYVNKLSV